MPQCGALVKMLEDKTVKTVFLKGLLASSGPMFFSALADRHADTIMFVLQDADEAGYFYHDLTQLMGTQQVLFYPSSYRRAVKYGQRDAGSEILRTEVLSRLAQRGGNNGYDEKGNRKAGNTEAISKAENAKAGSSKASKALYIVTCPEALSELVVSKQRLDERTLSLAVSQTVDIVETEKTLREFGFEQVDYVYEPGQFAVRGSILDVYSFSSELPFRIDFFGDEIDTIRTFNVEDQLSKDKKDAVEIVPELAKMTEEKMPLTSFLPADTVVAVKDLAYVADTIARIYDEGFAQQAVAERLEGATEEEQKEIMRSLSRDTQLVSGTRFKEGIAAFRRIDMGHKPLGTPQATITFEITPQPLFHKNFELLTRSLADYVLMGYKIYILADSEKQTRRLRDIFDSDEVKTKGEDLPFTPVDHTLHEGFADNTIRACFFTDHQIFDRFHKYSLKSDTARAGKMALTMKELQEMDPGDFIVHVDFGIGKFGGLVRVPVGNSYQEVIRIIYQRGDIVDVSIHSLYKISKYRSSTTGEAPRLSTLGTGAWERLKEKAKKKIKDIARDLIKLYAKRRHEKGFAFSGDSFMQHELEASFLYEDTPDQLKATQDVKADMEQAKPMDRLVCGDVGFGKTEVAIRAAFKAACDSKQVAVLVPTTVLAYQHFKSFQSRLKDFPVRVDYLSRARTTKQTKQVLEDLKDGKVDILVGTHKLIGKNVVWKDLGLLIIDEEQKFGVSTKEKLRQLKTNVDTLTMSATPIPRTLQFSLMGARDMSIMRTPPPSRHPIDTQVATFSVELLTDAINFEMSRGGQIYFVCNRIATLDSMKRIIERHVPDCRVAIGHGQMKPDELEKIVMGFINHDYDLLLSTTIVENGIDIPNANTIIINDANHFGLSDLHQMRGRVGRSNRKAFCYLLAPPLSSLPADSRRRLEALETFADLGSGFSLAMQDLDIRGAGNLLGAEQSGFMEDLGYETYQKILSQAVNELKNDEFQDLYAEQLAEGEKLTGEDFVDDCNVESDLQMYFPDYYVPGSSERMILYRELDNIQTDEDLEAYRKRMEDRFGPVPKKGEELMLVVMARRLGRMLGCEKLILKQHQMQMQFVSNKESMFYKSPFFTAILNYVASHPRYCNFKEVGGHNRLVVKNVASVAEAVKTLKKIINNV